MLSTRAESLPSSSLPAPTWHWSHHSSFSSQELPYTKDVIEAGLAEDTHLYYMALIERGTGRHLSFLWEFQSSSQGSFMGNPAGWRPCE